MNSDFLGDAPFGVLFNPDSNFFNATAGFTMNADVGATDFMVVDTPEPSTLLLCTSALLAVASRRRLLSR
jgi:hypothetical protein